MTMTEKIKEQILTVRDTALTNMFDFGQVKMIAEQMEFPELVQFIEESPDDYANFILTGKE